MNSLRSALESAHPLYVLPRENVAKEVLIPSLRAAERLDIMMGYFSSSSLGEIAPGLSTFLKRHEAPMRVVISPFMTEDDYFAVTRRKEELLEAARKLLLGGLPDSHALSKHTLECFAWLISRGRLILRLAFMRNARFHPKVWLFEDAGGKVALHGSSNLTLSGMTSNHEQLTLSRDWKSDESKYHVERLRVVFDEIWLGEATDCVVLDLPQALTEELVTRFKVDVMPSERAVLDLWERAERAKDDDHESSQLSLPPELRIPRHLEYQSGPFAHQGDAVDAWEAVGRQGILEMATGAGKTITSMIAAARLQDEVGKLLVLVSAPYRPLIEQWCGEVSEFGIEPVNLSEAGGADHRNAKIKQAARNLRFGVCHTEVLIVSNSTLCTPEFIDLIESVDVPKLLIADECHNLGTSSFIANPPYKCIYRLGLSATPVRQYDAEGTAALFDYFGETCYEFSLEDAIGKCLTEYDYHVHYVELTAKEMNTWRDLTLEIGKKAWKLDTGESDEHLDSLMRKRRIVLETADRKIQSLSDMLDQMDLRSLRHTLIYTTDKMPEQLLSVNELLHQKGVVFRQLTHEESSNRELTKNILNAFQEGSTQVLTAKRVLDEGVNIPQIKLAFVLASTTVRRQWIQRRGRLLRTCPSVGKKSAEIHDFVVLPPDARHGEIDKDARRIVKSELERVWEFAHLSKNAALPGGSYEAVRELESMMEYRGFETNGVR
ncbi:MAG: DEAD/DEAH box helicase family protein [Aestuariivita sp.]|nr:DEAD/DEAH box helicase family protein [Aestuariivita sp.]